MRARNPACDTLSADSRNSSGGNIPFPVPHLQPTLSKHFLPFQHTHHPWRHTERHTERTTVVVHMFSNTLRVLRQARKETGSFFYAIDKKRPHFPGPGCPQSADTRNRLKSFPPDRLRPLGNGARCGRRRSRRQAVAEVFCQCNIYTRLYIVE